MDVVERVSGGTSGKLQSCKRCRRPRGMTHVRARRLSRSLAHVLTADPTRVLPVLRCRSDVAASSELVDESSSLLPWQPKHTVTRRTAQISREVQSAWKSHVGSRQFISAEDAKQLFNDLQLFPSETEVFEMLECAKVDGGRPTASYLTFKEFCFYASELKKGYDRGTQKTIPLWRVQEKNGSALRQPSRKMSKAVGKFEVFLGGSCNPTTWRTDVAIPMLTEMGITFYNPQVSHWRPELLELEYRAKENAHVLFFVLDNQTRSVSALIEVAHIAGQRRKLVLVVQSYTQLRQAICGEHISQREYEDLRDGQQVLQRLVERQGIPVFDNIRVALQCTAKVLRENLTVEEVGAGLSRNEHDIDVRKAFESFDANRTGHLTVQDACSACSALLGRPLSLTDLRTVLPALPGWGTEGNIDTVRIDLSQFNQLVSLLRNSQENEAMRLPHRRKQSVVSNGPRSRYLRDVYLGGSTRDTEWRDLIAIPLLEKQNISWVDSRTEEDSAAAEDSSVLLFVITDTCRSIAAMAVAGHYIGRGRAMVLCVQELSDNAVISGETLTQIAIKDYNRGRMYLADLARRAEVPVFNNITDAAACAARTALQKRN